MLEIDSVMSANAGDELHHSFTIYSFILADQGSDSQTTGSTLKGHLLARIALPPPTISSSIFSLFTLVYLAPFFFLSCLTKFHQLPHALPYFSHEYSEFDFCYLV